jgi:hypothetical protein
MDVGRRIILVVLAVAGVGGLVCFAQPERPGEERKEGRRPDIFAEPGGGRGGPRFFKLSEEMIKRVMDALEKSNPEKAKELAKLREKDPEQFKAELRIHGHDEFGKMFREQMESRRRRWETDYVEWLGKNYPREAEDIKKHKDKDPELYNRMIWLSMERYGEIFRASRENPELAVILKEDLELRDKRDELLKKIKAAKEEEEKKKLSAELREVAGDRFDLIVRRKEIAYEQLLKRLEELKKQVEKNKAEIAEWKDPKFKEENVKKHLDDLLKGLPKFRWD